MNIFGECVDFAVELRVVTPQMPDISDTNQSVFITDEYS